MRVMAPQFAARMVGHRDFCAVMANFPGVQVFIDLRIRGNLLALFVLQPM